MNAAKSELFERNRQLLEQMETLRRELEQSRNAHLARNPPDAPAAGARAGASFTPATDAKPGGRKPSP